MFGEIIIDVFIQFSEKLKSGHHSNDMKLQLLQNIAAESGIEWSSKALENKLFRDAFNKVGTLVKMTSQIFQPFGILFIYLVKFPKSIAESS